MKAAIWYSKKYMSRRKRFILAMFIVMMLVSTFVSFNLTFYYQIKYRNERTVILFSRLVKFWLINPVPANHMDTLREIEGVDCFFTFMSVPYEIEDITSGETISYQVEFVNLSLVQKLLIILDYHEEIIGDICIGFGIALKLNAKIGDVIRIRDYDFVLNTILPQTFSDLDYFIFVNINVYYNYIAPPELKEKVNGAYVLLREEASEDYVIDKITELYDVRYVLSPSRVVTRMTRINRVQLISNLFFSIIAIIIGMSIILIYLFRDLETRRRELAILSALGVKRKQILLVVIVPLILVIVPALIIGCLTAFYIAIPYYHEVIYGYIRLFADEAYVDASLLTFTLLFFSIFPLIFLLDRKLRRFSPMSLLRAEI